MIVKRNAERTARNAKKCSFCVRSAPYPRSVRGEHWSEYQGKPTLYFLPKEGYIGITKQYFQQRLKAHRIAGKDITGWSAINFDNIYDAVAAEAFYHKIGFNGGTFK